MSATELTRQQLVRSLYGDHHGWLFAWLRKKLGCPEQAADFAHDTFIRLFNGRELHRLREPRAFLVTTATRLIIDDARRRRVERACLEACAIIEADGDAPPPEYWIETAQTLNAIATMLDDLPDKPRRAFLLNRLDDMPHAKIASALGVSVSMIKKYIAQALMHCYRVLRELEAGR